MKKALVFFLILLVSLTVLEPFCYAASSKSKTTIPSGLKKSYSYYVEDKTIMPVKERLYELGYSEKKDLSTAFLGNTLKNSVKAFQKKNGLTEDGVIDTKLYKVLFSPSAIAKNGKAVSSKTKKKSSSSSYTYNTNITKKSGTATTTKKPSSKATKVITTIVPLPTIQVSRGNELQKSGIWIIAGAGVLFLLVAGIVILLISRSGRKLYDIRHELAKIDYMDSATFEMWCATLLKRYGFENVVIARTTGETAADILCTHNGGRVAVLCERSAKKVDQVPVQEALGAKSYFGSKKTLVITNSSFTEAADRMARDRKVALWDRTALKEIMKAVNERYAKKQKFYPYK